MHHARQHAETRTRERRHRLAHEAARLMAEGGFRDYHQAKLKAAERLGIHDDASLPRNREIEDALREYQRLFIGGAQWQAVQVRRDASLRALEFFAPFSPRLVGPVLEGTADTNSPVTCTCTAMTSMPCHASLKNIVFPPKPAPGTCVLTASAAVISLSGCSAPRN